MPWLMRLLFLQRASRLGSNSRVVSGRLPTSLPSCKHALNYQGLHVPGRLPNYRCFRNASAQVPVALRMMDDIFTLPHKRVKMPWRVRDWEVEKCWSWKEIYFMASGEVGLSWIGFPCQSIKILFVRHWCMWGGQRSYLNKCEVGTVVCAAPGLLWGLPGKLCLWWKYQHD